MNKKMTLVVVFLGLSLSSFSQSLEDYYKIASENNPGVQARYKAFEAALQRVQQVGDLPDPNLSIGYFISPVETRVGPQQARISLIEIFPWFGTLAAQEDVASLEAQVKYQQFFEIRNHLYFKLSVVYYSIYELDQWSKNDKENIEILEVYKSIASKRFENGKGSMVDILRVDMMLNDASINLSILENKRVPLQTRFNLLLNRSKSHPILITDTLTYKQDVAIYKADSLFGSNPTIEELDFKVESYKARVRLANKNGLPKMGVGLDYLIIGERKDVNLADNGKDVLMPMISISLPIFRGKYRAAKKEAILLRDLYVLEKEDRINNLQGRYAMLSFEIEKQRELIKLCDQQQLASQQSLNLLYKSYGSSGEGFEEVLRMQQQLLKYQKLSITALVEYYKAAIEIDYLIAKPIR